MERLQRLGFIVEGGYGEDRSWSREVMEERSRVSRGWRSLSREVGEEGSSSPRGRRPRKGEVRDEKSYGQGRF